MTAFKNNWIFIRNASRSIKGLNTYLCIKDVDNYISVVYCFDGRRKDSWFYTDTVSVIFKVHIL